MHHDPQDPHAAHTTWARFFIMVGSSTLVMFFLMYQMVYSLGDATFSLNRLLAAMVMGSAMTVVMLIFMWEMYDGTGTKLAILWAAGVLGLTILFVNREQILVTDQEFLGAMIPHHSIAINNAQKASLRDPRVRALADSIIENQLREIVIMKALAEDLRTQGPRGTVALPPVPAQITPEMQEAAQEALR